MPLKLTELHLKGWTETVCVDFSQFLYNNSQTNACNSSWRQSSEKSASLKHKQELLQGGRVQTKSLYLLGRQELLPSYQTVMTELSVAVTQRNTLALINLPLPLLCSPNPISNPLCLSCFFVHSLTNGLSIPQRETEREAGGLIDNKSNVRVSY